MTRVHRASRAACSSRACRFVRLRQGEVGCEFQCSYIAYEQKCAMKKTYCSSASLPIVRLRKYNTTLPNAPKCVRLLICALLFRFDYCFRGTLDNGPSPLPLRTLSREGGQLYLQQAPLDKQDSATRNSCHYYKTSTFLSNSADLRAGDRESRVKRGRELSTSQNH